MRSRGRVLVAAVGALVGMLVAAGPGTAPRVDVDMHHPDWLRLSAQPAIPYPAAALTEPETRCDAQVDIGEDGVPYRAEVLGCPAVFADAARSGLLAWRWYPPVVDGKPTRARTGVWIAFRPTGQPAPHPCSCICR